MTALRFGAASDVGLVRANNQDQLLVASPLFAVADGMGGHAAGEVASLTAVQALEVAFNDHPDLEGLREAAEEANRAVWDLAQTHPELRGMGTTLVAMALVHSEGQEVLGIINIGDSRLYLLRRGDIEQLTRDHSLVQELVDEGQLSEAEASVHPQRHILTRALGVDPDVTPDVIQLTPVPGDRYLLCSDGLPREVSDRQIAAILRRLADPDQAARNLVEEAKSSGGNDNITVIVVDLLDSEAVGNETAAGGAALTRPSSGRRATGGPVGAADDPTVAMATVATRVAVSSRPRRPDDGDPTRQFAPARSGTGNQVQGLVRLGLAGGTKRRGRRRPVLTLRVAGFLLVVLLVLGVAAGAIAWYARGSYFVTLQGKELVIERGRPGGLLWFSPTLAAKTAVTTADVLPANLADLRAGMQEPSMAAARQYVDNLVQAARSARAARRPVVVKPTTTTTVPPSTVPPTTAPPTTAPPTTTSASTAGTT